MKLRETLRWILVLLLAGCAAPTPEVIKQTVIVMQDPLPTATPMPTYTPLPTYTPQDPLPTYTPAATYTPLPTYTAPPPPTPTPTPTETSTPAPTATPTAVPTATPKPPFVIRHEVFQARPQDKCSRLDIIINDIQGGRIAFTFKDGSEIPTMVPLMRCFGGKYTWEGTLTYQGFTFASDENNPLQFQIGEAGYLYLKGVGTVTYPDGTTVSLPQ
jgi:hypothetical protein